MSDALPSDGPQTEELAELGRGSSARVTLARLVVAHAGSPAGTEVAVKQLHPELAADAEARAVLAREAEVLEHVQSPRVVRLIHSAHDAAAPFLVLEHLPGPTLSELLESAPLDEKQLCALAAELAEGLSALHGAGFTHGDVKPDNVRFDRLGRATWIDLGFALRGQETPRARPGSLPWLPPEEARGAPGSPAADMFALGLILFQLATARHPFLPHHGAPAAEPLESDLLETLARARSRVASEVWPAASAFTDALLADLLSRDPALRPTAAEVLVRASERRASAWWISFMQQPHFPPRRTDPSDTVGLPFVGRARELARMGEAWKDVQRSGGRALWLRGPAGIGRTRLVRESALQIRSGERLRETPLLLRTSCGHWEVDRAAEPIRRMFASWMGVGSLGAEGEGPPPAPAREELAALLPPLMVETLLRGLPQEGSRGEDLDATRPVALSAALSTWLTLLGRRRPLILLVDRIELARDATLDVLSALAGELGSTRILLVLGARDEEAPSSKVERLRERLAARAPSASQEHSELVVPALTEHEVADWVGAIFDPRAPRLRLSQRLWQRTQGNPTHIVEALKELHRRGALAPNDEGSALVLTGNADEIPLPRSLGATIAARFRGLEPDERTWLQRLAVAGASLTPGFLVRAYASVARAGEAVLTVAEVERRLLEFERLGWLERISGRYRFVRSELREVAYRSLDDQQRAELHALAATALSPEAGAAASRAGAQAPVRVEFQRAYHLRAAGDHAALLELVPGLLGRLLDRGHPRRVSTICEWGLEALDHAVQGQGDPEDVDRLMLRIELLETAADLADRLGDRARQRERLDKLSAINLDPTGDPVGAGRVYLLHGRFAASTGDNGLARGLFLNALQFAERGKAGSLVSEALRRIARVQASIGDLTRAEENARRARKEAVTQLTRAQALAVEGQIALLLDQFERALGKADEARRILYAEKHARIRELAASTAGTRRFAGAHRRADSWTVHERSTLASVFLLRARVYRGLGRTARALAAVQHASSLARQAGERRQEAEAEARRGGMLIELGREQEAEERLRDALLVAREIEDAHVEALASLWLGTLLCERADAEGPTLLERAGRVAHEGAERRMEALAASMTARVRLAQGDLAGASRRARSALDLSEQVGAELPDRVTILGTSALVERESGRPEAAQELEDLLHQHVNYVAEQLESRALRQGLQRAMRRLAALVASREGPVVPRRGAR